MSVDLETFRDLVAWADERKGGRITSPAELRAALGAAVTEGLPEMLARPAT